MLYDRSASNTALSARTPSNVPQDKHPMTTNSDQVRYGTAKRLLAGAVAGALAKTAVAPLDRTKILMQVSSMYGWSSHRGSVLSSMRVIAKTEGFFGFFRGNSATVARIMPYAAIQYTMFEQANGFLARRVFGEGSHHPMKRFTAGAIAGTTSVAMTYPIDMARTVLAVRVGRGESGGLVRTLVDVVRERGIGGLYRGVYPTLVGVVPYAGISFLSFGILKRKADDMGVKDRPLLTHLICGGGAGLMAQCCTYPLDMVRRRLQALHDPKLMTRWERAFLRAAKRKDGVVRFSIFKAVLFILRKEGVKGLYRGVSINFMKTAPSMAISFTCYDALRKALGVPSGKYSATSA